MTATASAPRRPPTRARGFTLIELLVTLVIAVIFGLAVLIIQGRMARQNMQMSDVGQRDSQLRAALDVLTRDLSNAGFLLGGTQAPCATTLSYNSALTPAVGTQYAVSALAQTAGAQLPATGALAGTPMDPAQYALVGGVNTSQMILMSVSTGALQAPSAGTAPAAYSVQNAAATAIPGQGAVDAGVLPLNTTAGLAAGDVGLLRVALNQQLVCFRMPITAVTAVGSPQISAAGSPLLPSGFSVFNTRLQQLGVLPAGQPLTNANFVRARLVDLGPAAGAGQQTVAYYVARVGNGAGGFVPVLARAVINAGTDTLIGTPTPVAAGVVNLQALFGVDETNSGGVTNYLSWPRVLAGNWAPNVRSVLFAFVTRTMQANADRIAGGTAAATVASVAVPSPGLNAGDDQFAPYMPQAGEQQNRFAVLTSEIAVRNQIWPR